MSGVREQDPRRFLARFPDGAILDEVQRAQPYCRGCKGWSMSAVMGQFVLTGSAQFDLIAGMSQSLAGRVGRVELLPLSLDEIGKEPASRSMACCSMAAIRQFISVDSQRLVSELCSYLSGTRWNSTTELKEVIH